MESGSQEVWVQTLLHGLGADMSRVAWMPLATSRPTACASQRESCIQHLRGDSDAFIDLFVCLFIYWGDRFIYVFIFKPLNSVKAGLRLPKGTGNRAWPQCHLPCRGHPALAAGLLPALGQHRVLRPASTLVFTSF